jgi:hypothetical protein
MIHKQLVGLMGVLLTFACVDAAEQRPVDSLRKDGVLFLDAHDVATALNLQFKVQQPGRLVTFCRQDDPSYCIPVRLSAENHHLRGSDVLLEAQRLGAALQFELETRGDQILVTRLSDAATPAETGAAGYNAHWGPGRGFRAGDTLPDIPLVDLEDNEVRFSQFLGQRYILYCWASW